MIKSGSLYILNSSFLKFSILHHVMFITTLIQTRDSGKLCSGLTLDGDGANEGEKAGGGNEFFFRLCYIWDIHETCKWRCVVGNWME